MATVERHLYRIRYKRTKGQWSVYYQARFRDWQGNPFQKRLSDHLPTARKLLREYEKLNDERQPLILEGERKAAEVKRLAEEKANAMTITKFVPYYKEIIKAKRSADRDDDVLAHIIRIKGDTPLAEISEGDVTDYTAQRRKETLIRYGKFTKIPVRDGTVRIELSTWRHLLNLARRHRADLARKGIRYDVATVSFEGLMPKANHRNRVLKDAERQRLLEESPVWLRRLLIVALETCLSRGDLLRLTWADVDEEGGVIVPNGGRLKTEVTQASPLTEPVREILAEIKRERKQSKVHNLKTAHLVFVREDGRAITGDMITKARRNACKLANVPDFRFHDTRHDAKTRWARAGVSVEVAMKAAGHASIAMHQAYVHLQASDVARAFGTAKKG